MLFFQNVNQSNTYTFIYEYIHIQLSTILLHFLLQHKYVERFESKDQVPEELKEVLLQFSISFLVEQPPDVIDYAVEYFTKLQSERPSVSHTDQSTDDQLSVNSQDADGKWSVLLYSSSFFKLPESGVLLFFFFYFRLQSNSIACPVNFFLA